MRNLTLKSSDPGQSSAATLHLGGQRTRLLIVDDDATMSRYLSTYFGKKNFEVNSAFSGEEALKMFRAFDPQIVLMDITMPGISGVETLERLSKMKPSTCFIVISGLNNPDLVFRASKAGANDYLAKPFDVRELEARMAKLVEAQQESVRSAPHVTAESGRYAEFSMIFGTSPKMEEVKMTIEKVADTNATVLIRGESGTGKEMVARMVYANSMRREKPFVKVNCAAIPHELLESELFGYEQGAFTGANRQKLGKFDQANYGTIFLDEVSEMHPALQAKLLHVLQDGEFARLGGKRDISVDTRVLAATNKPLERSVAEGAFREDLFYRLNVVTIHIPPLRERREEIPVFLDFFLRKYSEYYGKHPAAFSDNAINKIMDYPWPGNIRELENLVKRYTIVGNEGQIIRELSTHKPIVSSMSPQHDGLAPHGPNGQTYGDGHGNPFAHTGGNAGGQAGHSAATSGANAAGQPFGSGSFGNGGQVRLPHTIEGNGESFPSLLEIGKRAAMKAEREAIERVLAQTRWNRRQAAKILKISYKALLNKLKLIEEQDRTTEAEQRPS